MNTNFLKYAVATGLPVIGLAGVCSVQAAPVPPCNKTIIVNETLGSAQGNIDKFTVKCPIGTNRTNGTMWGAARVIETGNTGDSNKVKVQVTYAISNANRCGDSSGPKIAVNGQWSALATSKCFAGFYTVWIGKTQPGSETYQSQITCRDANMNLKCPLSFSITQDK